MWIEEKSRHVTVSRKSVNLDLKFTAYNLSLQNPSIISHNSGFWQVQNLVNSSIHTLPNFSRHFLNTLLLAIHFRSRTQEYTCKRPCYIYFQYFMRLFDYVEGQRDWPWSPMNTSEAERPPSQHLFTRCRVSFSSKNQRPVWSYPLTHMRIRDATIGRQRRREAETVLLLTRARGLDTTLQLSLLF